MCDYDDRIDINDPVVRAMIDDYRKQRSYKDSRTEEVKIKKENIANSKAELVKKFKKLKKTTHYLDRNVRIGRDIVKPKECIVCELSFKEVSYKGRGMCKDCYTKFLTYRDSYM